MDVPKLSEFSLLLWVPLLTLGFGLIYSLLVQPFMMPRYLINCAGIFLLAGAIGLSTLEKKWGPIVGVAILAALNLPISYRMATETFNGPFHELEQIVTTEKQLNTVMLHGDVMTIYSAAHLLTEPSVVVD